MLRPKRNRYRKILLLSLLAILTACDLETDTTGARYPEAANQNMDVRELSIAIDQLSDVLGFQSVILGRGGVIAAEEYYNSGGADVLHDVRSVTKSVMALLIGIAIEEGFIQSEDEAIRKYLRAEIGDGYVGIADSVSIKHLLTMSCGLEWHELDGGNSYSQWYSSVDHVRWVLDQPKIHPPGDGFNYNTGSTYLLSVILTRASGMSALGFAQTYLFGPMGIEESDWKWVPLNGQYNNGGAGLEISPPAMFALGTLMLNGGTWEGEQLVPEAWVSKCIDHQNTPGGGNSYATEYGYLWWGGAGPGGDHFYAMGWGGQFIVCVPDLDLVVSATCAWQGYSRTQTDKNWFDIFVIIMEGIIPAVE